MSKCTTPKRDFNVFLIVVDLSLKVLHVSDNHNNTLSQTKMTQLQDREPLLFSVQTSYLILSQIGTEIRQVTHKEGIVPGV